MNKVMLLIAACVLCAGSAAAQNIGPAMANGDPQMRWYAYEHSPRATQTGLAREQDIRERDEVTYGHGEKPLWEFAPVTSSQPLGDVARSFKQDRATAKKAVVTWSN